MRKLPSEFLALPRLEKAFIIASIQIKIEAEKKVEDEAKRKQNTGKKGRGRRR